MTLFVEAALSAFSGLAAAHGWSIGKTSDSEWFARVEWDRGDDSLAVSDDRRDRIVEVRFERPMTDEDLALRHLAVRNSRFGLPLWALAEAAGGIEAEAVAVGEEAGRVGALPRLAAATVQYGGALLSGDWSRQGDALAVIERHHKQNSEEGRRARRFLP